MRTVEDVLADPLPDNCQPHQVLSMVVVTEYLTEDGDVMLGYQRTAEAHEGPWRHVGMLTTVIDQMRYDLVDKRLEDDEDD